MKTMLITIGLLLGTGVILEAAKVHRGIVREKALKVPKPPKSYYPSTYPPKPKKVTRTK